MPTNLKQVRRKILRDRGVELEKHTRTPISYIDLPVPYGKTALMKLLELQNNRRIEELISPQEGSIYQVAKKLGIDASTVSKWRKLIDDAYFWEQFE